MKVLVTGATGFLGQHLVPRLLERGHAVIAVARNETKAREFSWFHGVEFIACDLHRRQGNMFELFQKPDVVMHLAWTGLPNYGDLFHYEENLPADYRLLKSMVEAGASHLLVTGTCFEYGMRNGVLAEQMLTAPANPYALAKDSLRKFLQALQLKNNFILQWARLFYMYGPGQNPNSLLAQLDRAIDSGETVFNMSGGEQLRDYLPVEEVASRLVALAQQPLDTGVLNICSGTPVSIRRLVELHAAKRNASIRLNLGHYPYPDYEPMAFWGDATRQNSILNQL